MKRFTLILVLVLAVLSMGTKGIIAAEKTFKAIASPFPPFTSPDLENNGLAWEICRAAFETQGYIVTLSFAPWARAMEESKNGRYDGLLPAYWTEERTQWFVYPMPLVIIHTGFIKRKSREEIVFNGDLRTLTEYDIGVGKGYSTNDAFDKADYLNKVFVSTTPQVLKMLWLGHVDLAVGGFEYSVYYLNRIESEPKFRGIKDDIILMKPPLKSRYAYIVISKKTPDCAKKLKDFNIGMREIMLDGTYKQILGKYGLSD